MLMKDEAFSLFQQILIYLLECLLARAEGEDFDGTIRKAIYDEKGKEKDHSFIIFKSKFTHKGHMIRSIVFSRKSLHLIIFLVQHIQHCSRLKLRTREEYIVNTFPELERIWRFSVWRTRIGALELRKRMLKIRSS